MVMVYWSHHNDISNTKHKTLVTFRTFADILYSRPRDVVGKLLASNCCQAPGSRASNYQQPLTKMSKVGIQRYEK